MGNYRPLLHDDCTECYVPTGLVNHEPGGYTFVTLADVSYRIYEMSDKTFRVAKKGRFGWLVLEYQWSFTDLKDDWENMALHKGNAFGTFEAALDYLKNPDKGYHNARKSERVVNTTEFRRV